MQPKTCYCINPHCQQPDLSSNINNNFCSDCGSNLIINSKYRVKRLLSDDSGFGIIYEAENNQRKILKVLREEHNKFPKAIDLFQQEYQVLLDLTNQVVTGVAQVEKDDYFQYQTKTGLILYCFVMEKVEGIDLQQWLKNNGKISQEQALKWLKEITQILAKIHQQNYFHRDIKPANIMQRNNGQLVLIDFGTAREETQTYYQKLQGQNVTGIYSPGYTPEEQRNGKTIMQSDFFALGRTFVHLLTGKSPFDIYDDCNNVFKWRNHAENINPLLLDFLDELMAVAAKDRPVNTNVILKQLNGIETRINQHRLPIIPIKRTSPISPQSKSKNIKKNIKIDKRILISSILLIGIGYGVIQLRPIYYITQAAIYSELKEYYKAIADYNQAIKLNPNLALAYYNRGNAYYDLKEYEKALADYTQVIKLNPNYVYAYNNRGLAYSDLKEYDKAIADYNQAIKLNPNLAKTYYNRGLAYSDLKEYDKAIADYNQAIKLNPNYVYAYNNRGLAYSDLKEYEKAIADYKQVIKLNPNLAEAYNNRGNAYSDLKEYDKAIADYNQAINLNPNYANAYNNRGNAHFLLKEHKKALADYNKTIKLNPNYAEAYYNRGNAYSNLKEYEKALADYTQAMILNPNLAEAYYNRGNAYSNLKQYQNALADFNQTIKLNPNYAEAYYNRGITNGLLGNTQYVLSDFRQAATLFQQQGNTEGYNKAMNIIKQLESWPIF